MDVGLYRYWEVGWGLRIGLCLLLLLVRLRRCDDTIYTMVWNRS